MLKFIDDFNVIHDNQFGFRRNRYTYMALNVLLDKFHESVTSTEYIIGLFMDLSRAFAGADPGGGAGGPSESLGIDFYSGYRKKFPGIDFYSGFRGNAQVGIDFQKA